MSRILVFIAKALATGIVSGPTGYVVTQLLLAWGVPLKEWAQFIASMFDIALSPDQAFWSVVGVIFLVLWGVVLYIIGRLVGRSSTDVPEQAEEQRPRLFLDAPNVRFIWNVPDDPMHFTFMSPQIFCSGAKSNFIMFGITNHSPYRIEDIQIKWTIDEVDIYEQVKRCDFFQHFDLSKEEDVLTISKSDGENCCTVKRSVALQELSQIRTLSIAPDDVSKNHTMVEMPRNIQNVIVLKGLCALCDELPDMIGSVIESGTFDMEKMMGFAENSMGTFQTGIHLGGLEIELAGKSPQQQRIEMNWNYSIRLKCGFRPKYIANTSGKDQLFLPPNGYLYFISETENGTR